MNILCRTINAATNGGVHTKLMMKEENEKKRREETIRGFEFDYHVGMGGELEY